jgi:hypothetical protein
VRTRPWLDTGSQRLDSPSEAMQAGGRQATLTAAKVSAEIIGMAELFTLNID